MSLLLSIHKILGLFSIIFKDQLDFVKLHKTLFSNENDEDKDDDQDDQKDACGGCLFCVNERKKPFRSYLKYFERKIQIITFLRNDCSTRVEKKSLQNYS